MPNYQFLHFIPLLKTSLQQQTNQEVHPASLGVPEPIHSKIGVILIVHSDKHKRCFTHELMHFLVYKLLSLLPPSGT